MDGPGKKNQINKIRSVYVNFGLLKKKLTTKEKKIKEKDRFTKRKTHTKYVCNILA